MILGLLTVVILPIISQQVCAQPESKVANKPLYHDPVYDGAADPVVIWNQQEKKWFMFYTNRRANIDDADGVKFSRSCSYFFMVDPPTPSSIALRF